MPFLRGTRYAVAAAGGSSAAPAFTPASLSNLVFWVKRTGPLFSDAGTTPAVDADPVYRWVDSVNSITGDQATLANRPILTSGASGYLTFDGASDWIGFGTPAQVQATGQHSMWALIRTSATLIGAGFRAIYNYPNGFLLAGYDNGSTITLASYDWGGGATRDSGISIRNGNWRLVGANFDVGVASGSSWIVDGVTVGSAFTYSSSTYSSNLRIGANQFGGERWDGDIAEVGHVVGRNITSDEWASIKAYYGV